MFMQQVEKPILRVLSAHNYMELGWNKLRAKWSASHIKTELGLVNISLESLA